MNILVTGVHGLIGYSFLTYVKSHYLSDDFRIIPITSKDIAGCDCILYTEHGDHVYDPKEFASKGIDHVDYVILLGAFVEHGEKTQIVRKHISSINSIAYLLDHLPSIPKRVIFMSSVAVYGFTQTDKYIMEEMQTVSEETPLNPKRTYALSKLLCEKMIAEWGEENGCETVILRLASAYGKEKRFYNFLGTCVQNAINGVEMDMYAPLEKTWNFVYTDDVSKWIMNALLNENIPGLINLASSNSYKTQEVLDIVSEVFPTFQYSINNDRPKTGQDRLFDVTKREKYLGNEEYDLEKGLMEIYKN